MFSFVKDGQNKGERSEESSARLEAGQTFRVSLKDFMYEPKKAEEQRVFPGELDAIPAFSVVEVMVCPANTHSFEEGFGFHVQRVRPCDFTLHSVQTPLGLGLLPPTYEDSVRAAEAHIEANPGLRRTIEGRNTGFFGRVRAGSYLVPYSEDLYRLVGPKENPDDPESKHLNVMEGGVFAIDFPKAALLQFTNAVEESDEYSVQHAHMLVDLASARDCLSCYVTHNEYLLRSVRALPARASACLALTARRRTRIAALSRACPSSTPGGCSTSSRSTRQTRGPRLSHSRSPSRGSRARSSCWTRSMCRGMRGKSHRARTSCWPPRARASSADTPSP